MEFKNATEVENIAQQLRQADYKRSQDRALIDQLFDGAPPYSPEEAKENNVFINVNDLTAPRMAHNARMQFSQNFLKQGQFFSCRTDMGPAHKRQRYGNVVTKEINKRLKRSLDYYECFRSKFALNILHGIGPAIWRNDDEWCPEPIAINDLLVPSGTLLSFRNLPFFIIQKSYTVPELISLTKREDVDPGWNMKLVNSVLEWADKESRTLFGSASPDIWSPEKTQERLKSDGSLYAGDRVPTIDVFIFHYWSDEDKTDGWRRRIILDAWNNEGGIRKLDFPGKGDFLYDSGSRVYANRREEIFSCQFADLSARAPFRFHSVRSLGFLLYAVCHIQNRLRCRFNEAIFEALTMYFRVKSEEDVQQAMKVNLVNRGFIPKGLEFVSAADRWQVNANFVQLGMATNQKLIEDDVASFRTNPDFASDQIEKTKFQVMAELNAQTQLVSAAIQQAYQYQTFEYQEIFRRFLRENSKDPDVLEFRAACLKQGVSEAVLRSSEAWDIEPERVIGGGNKAMELAISQQLMQMRMAFDPEPQRQILRDVVMAMTDDPARAEMLVPQTPQVSDSVYNAQLAFGSLMAGAPVASKSGIVRQDYIQALMVSLATVVQRVEGMGGVPTPQELIGMQNVVQHIAENIQILAQDEEAIPAAKEFADQLGQLSNLIKAFGQRLQEQMQAGGGQNGESAKLQAELQADLIKAQAKAENQTEAHAQRTAQRQVAFEMDQQRKDVELERNLERREREAQLEGQIKVLQAQIDSLTKAKTPQNK
jgi:hypothetical protein